MPRKPAAPPASPPPGIPLREMLALAMTSAKSQRELARALGITHQKLGRWLREGEPGGVKQIPRDAETILNVNLIFELHRDAARAQAQALRLPHNEARPIYWQRPILADGQPTERPYIAGAQHLGPELRARVIADQAATRQFEAVAAISKINWATYARFERPQPGTQRLISTTRQALRADAPAQAVKGIEKLLNAKHAPHSDALAERLMFSTYPEQFQGFPRPAPKRKRRRR